MLRKWLLTSVSVLWVGSCYSNINPYYGYTGNAFLHGNPWSMDSVLPEPTGLDVNGVFYTYTPNKETNADFEVEIGNHNADGTGYVWKETDNWDGVQGGIAIIKNVPLPYVPRSQFGDGFLNTTGEGTVEDANLIYSYKVDPCFNPQADINCPGFIPPTPTIVDMADIYDATEDSVIEQFEVKSTDTEAKDTDVKSDEELEEEERSKRLERAMSITDNSALFAEGFAQSIVLQQMNNSINVTTYLAKTIQGGNYNDSIELEGGNLPDNNGGRRMNWSTQKLHDELVGMQYNAGE